MAAKKDYSTWLTKEQAAEAIGVSTKTVERLAAEKQLQQARRTRPETGVKVAVYHPDDVERLRQERNPGAEPFVLPPEPEPTAGQSLALVAPGRGDDATRALVTAIAAAVQPGGVRIAERLYLTLDAAAEYTGLPKSHLAALRKADTLPALKTGAGWRFRRTDLDKL